MANTMFEIFGRTYTCLCEIMLEKLENNTSYFNHQAGPISALHILQLLPYQTAKAAVRMDVSKYDDKGGKFGLEYKFR
jgi:hypothetical protein